MPDKFGSPVLSSQKKQQQKELAPLAKTLIGYTFITVGLVWTAKYLIDVVLGEDEVRPDPKRAKVNMANVTQGFNPSILCGKLYDCMDGLNVFDCCIDIFREVRDTPRSDLRLMHNYWIDHVDDNESIYMWIEQEYNCWPWEAREEAMDALNTAGVGFDVEHPAIPIANGADEQEGFNRRARNSRRIVTSGASYGIYQNIRPKSQCG